MISILIPVFNRNVVELVRSLQSEVSAVKEKVEIIVMDDASDNTLLRTENRIGLTAFQNAQYLELLSNTGRNIIRHKLAAAANYDTLIFLDADSTIPGPGWLQRYINARAGHAVIMGGRTYSSKTQGTDTLHFHYGESREQCSAAQRNEHPYRSFLACNFLIDKQQLSQLITDNKLFGYCHEDTFMGMQFENLDIPVIHIDNPVIHEGIDDDGVFINKQQEALDNLQYLYRTYKGQYDFSAIRLIRVYKKIAGNPAGRYFLNTISGNTNKFRERSLYSHRLFWLDLWKLASWHQLTKQCLQ